VAAGEPNGGEVLGRVLGGRYRVTGVLGRGGMGVVGRAVDELLNREVAVKILRAYTDASGPELADLRVRMRREAQAAARIRHSGVVTVHDVIEDQGLPVIVMELVDGPSLDEVLAERGALQPHEAAAIGAQLMDALDAAHRVGVLHRDVKPGNVLLATGGASLAAGLGETRVVLTDFGIASVETSGDEALAKLTRTGQLVGSLDYLPPERAQGREPGPASDIWSLGMTLYAAVEGAAPFRRTSVWSTLTAIVSEPLPEPRRAGALTPVLQALMAKDPAHRPSAERAREMLERVAAGRPANPAPQPAPYPTPYPAPYPPSQPSPYATPLAPAPTPVPVPAPAPVPVVAGPHTPAGARTLPLPDDARTGARGRRRARVVIAAAAAAVLIAGGATYALAGGHGGAGGTAQTAPSTGGAPAGSGQHAGDALTGTTPPDGSSQAEGAGSHGKGPATPTPGSSRATGGAPTTAAGTPSPTGHPAAPSPSDHPSATPTAVSKSCAGWTHQDPSPGTYGYMTGGYHIEVGPYETCTDIALAESGAKIWYHCYVVNAFGNKWMYVRIAGTNSAGWMSADNLTGQTGPSTRC
jgi:eukaryotic-like serine/threonine-protein kinase